MAMVELLTKLRCERTLRASATNTDLMTRMMLLRGDLAMLSALEMRFAPDADGIELCEPELNLLIDIVLTYLSASKVIPSAGSLGIYSQQVTEGGWGEPACLLLADLRDGLGHIPHHEWGSGTTTRKMVTSAVDEVFQCGKVGKKVGRKTPLLLPGRDDGTDAHLESGIYQDTFQSVLVLNSDLGRYVASYCDETLSNGHEMLPVIAQTLVCLRRDDEAIQESAMLVRNQLLESEWLCRDVMDVIERMFREQTDSLLVEWREWSYRVEA